MLQNLQRRLDKRDEGFTLIELLMVIVILAVLAAVVVFSVGGISNTSKTSACKSQVSTINTAAEAYYAQKNAGSTDIATLVTNGFLHPNANIGTGAASNTLTTPDYTVTFYASGSILDPGITGGPVPAAGDAYSPFCP